MYALDSAEDVDASNKVKNESRVREVRRWEKLTKASRGSKPRAPKSDS